MFPLISWMVFSPLIGAFLILFFRDDNEKHYKRIFLISIISSLVSFLFSLIIFVNFQASAEMQFVENIKWIESLGVSYRVGTPSKAILIAGMNKVFGKQVAYSA